MAKCASCNHGYYLNDKNQCIKCHENGKTDWSGHANSQCRCKSFYHAPKDKAISKDGSHCEKNQCTCENGKGAFFKECHIHDKHHCVKCDKDKGYMLALIETKAMTLEEAKARLKWGYNSKNGPFNDDEDAIGRASHHGWKILDSVGKKLKLGAKSVAHQISKHVLPAAANLVTNRCVKRKCKCFQGNTKL